MELEVLQHHSFGDGKAVALISNLQPTSLNGVIIYIDSAVSATLLVSSTGAALTDIDAGVAEIELTISNIRQINARHHEQLHPIGDVGGIGKVVDVIRTVVIQAVVAKRADDTILLVGEVQRGELVALMKVGLFLCGMKDAVLNAVAEGIADAVIEVRFTQMDVVGDALRTRFTLVNEAVINITTEVPVVLQDVRCHLGTRFRRHTGDGDRSASKGVEHPFVESSARLINKGIVNPKTHLEGASLGRTAQERTIGLVSQRSLHFRHCQIFSHRPLLVIHLHLLHTCVERFPFWQMGSGGTCHDHAHYIYV